MTTEQKLQKAVEAVQAVLAHHQAIFTNGRALAANTEAARVAFMNRVMATSGDGTPLHIDRGHPEIDVILSLESSKTYLATKNISDAVTSSPEYAEAVTILEPLIATVRKLEAALDKEKLEAAAIAQARIEARQAATEKALAEVEASFATV